MPSGSDVILVIVVVTALAFDFTNGFHDTANAIATSVSTRAMSPRFAVALSAVLNFAGAFISLKVAATIGSGIVDAGAITTTVVFAGLVGAITWNIATWWAGLPSSSSHALIGGLIGAALVADGPDVIDVDGIVEKVLVPAAVAPVLAFAVAALAILIIYRMVGALRPGSVTRGYRLGQIVTGSMFSLAHGTNDAQKTMGIITLALIAHGNLPADKFDVPFWVIVSSATAIALGTYTGGWRIIRTVGSRIIKMDPAQGFSAQGAGAAVVLTASHLGFPLSTTHVITGGVMGAGAAKRLSAVRWGLAGNIAVAWVLTLPAAALIGGLVYAISSAFGSGALGPVVVAVALLAMLVAVFARRLAHPPPPPAPGGGGGGMTPPIEAAQLFQLVWASALAGIAVAICFSLVIV